MATTIDVQDVINRNPLSRTGIGFIALCVFVAGFLLSGARTALWPLAAIAIAFQGRHARALAPSAL